jgi:hypothetical protein
MRLVMVCIVLFLAPAGCWMVTNRVASGFEDEFLQDATSQITRYNRITEMYPPKALTLHNAAAIRHLRQFSDGRSVAAAVCGPTDSVYSHLFDRLGIRCQQWMLFQRARHMALLGLAAAIFTLGLILMARIAVRRAGFLQERGGWSAWFASYGINIVLAFQVAAALAAFAILLRVLLQKPLYAYGALVLPWLGLLWVERRAVAAFVEPEKLLPLRAKRNRRKVRRAGASVNRDYS